jgi:hypothetical protein
MRVYVMAFVMATMIFLWRILRRHLRAYGGNYLTMANIASPSASLWWKLFGYDEYCIAICQPMVEIYLAMANIASPSASLWWKLFGYGEYGGSYLHMAIFWGEHLGDGWLFAAALSWARLISRATRCCSRSATRANREAESGKRRSSVVK